ncbi:MAG: efflux RND transporter permease subunit [Acidisphaera sp.]|nr:efflux RND transporter permease subunit [Acidisphaera sp.]
MSKFFIERPVLANVLALLMLLIGAVALFGLPVAQYPNVVPPTVQVTTRYPGASPVDVMRSVALPIEQQVNGVEGMLYMQSTSTSDGTYTLTVTFAIGTDLDFAQVLVQNRVASALASLPQAVQAQGVTVQKKSTSILQIITLTASDPRYDSLFLSNYATINLKDAIARLPGVGSVSVFGAGQYAMRLWLDPDKLQALGLTPQDVLQAVQQQSQDVTAGQVGAPPAPAGQAFQYTVNVSGRLSDPEQFGAIILKTGASNAITRVRDVARVDLGAQSYGQAFTLNGSPAAGIAVFQTPEANALEVAKAVRGAMATLAAAFPSGIVYAVPFDTTTFVSASVHDVYKTLIEAAILVLVVIVVFLQDWRAMLVPASTVPVTIIGAFAAMAALGFTINLSTLFAIVLVIGIVVDDAIIVVEAASHNLSRGMSGHDAAVNAMNALFAPIVGITLVLMSVFLPAAFLPGLTGRLYAQFALVIAATALLSAINAATLKPTQCALWLRPATPLEKRNVFFRGFNAVYDAFERRYARFIGFMVRHSGVMVVVALLAVVGAFALFARLPTGFLPLEDQGYMLVSVQLPDGASLERTQATLDDVQQRARKIPGVDQVISIAGISVLDNSASLANAGVAYVILKDWSQRGAGQDLRGMYTALSSAMDGVVQARALVIVPPAIQGIGNAGGFTMMVELRDNTGDFGELSAVTDHLVDNANDQSSLQRVATTFRAGVPQLIVEVDRASAETMHVAIGDVFQNLASYLGSTFAGQITKFGRTFQVYVQADAPYRLTPSAIEQLKVRNSEGNMVPLGALLHVRRTVGPSLITLYNLYPAATVIGAPATGFSSGEALSLMDRIAAATLPRGMATDWTAMSYQEIAVGNQMYYVFGLAVLLVYLVLAGQYESWLAPVSVILAVPLALLGPALVFTALGIENNLYCQIGLLLLIALSAKNAILVVEVAREERVLHGRPIVEAAIEAARARLRAIVMTSFAFILGVLPLVLASGAGANARKSIGITVFTGMLASTCLALLFVPSFFVVLQRFEERRVSRRPIAVAHPAE